MTDHVNSASDDRTANNAVRHTYRVLSDAEKAQMVAIKDAGAALIAAIAELRGVKPSPDDVAALWQYIAEERYLNIATARAEEAVMWAVKHITA